MRMPSPEIHPADLAACRALLRDGSRSFHAASLLLPRRIRAPATAIYAFCRLADDAVDLGDGKGRAVVRLQERLARAAEGRPLPIPADRAFAATLARHGIPRALPEALLEGLAWDAEGRRYETISDLRAYAARVAGSVGAMMSVLMGARGAAMVARACDLGVAMQLTNIARDVGEDARAGRLYIPLDWLREAGIRPEAWLAAPSFTPAVAGLVGRLLEEADRLYARAEAGIRGLPLDCRPGIGAARLIYGDIGREVTSAGHDSISRRAVVPASRKLALLSRAIMSTLRPGLSPEGAALPETHFLVKAVAAAPTPARRIAWWSVEQRAAFVIELFARLEQRDRSIQAEGLRWTGSETGQAS